MRKLLHILSSGERAIKNRPSQSSSGPLAPSPRLETANDSRSAGDQARDKQVWSDAIHHYENYVRAHPDDAAIWVQLGHALKESGNHSAAEQAYLKAKDLQPEDADVALQLGHVLKIMGRTHEAITAYAQALQLEATSTAYRELVALGQTVRADRLLGRLKAASHQPTMYLQINDLLHFLRIHKTPSGIQRVQLGIIAYYLTPAHKDETSSIKFVFNHPDDVRVWRASPRLLRLMIELLKAIDVDGMYLRKVIDDIFNDGVIVKPGNGDTFIVLGAFWGMPGNTLLMASLRNQGASIGLYVYDLIPVTHPEYCVQQLTTDFTRDLCEALQLVDYAIAISSYTANEIRNFIYANSFPNIPVEAVPLAHSLTGSSGLPAYDTYEADWTDAIASLEGKDYVLCVCTIEARKNHRYLIDAWRILKQQGIDVPDLLFVGRRGWRVDELFAQLEDSDYLDGSVKILHDLSDAELEILYRNCRFTVFPSIVEGWGLPVGESLIYGKLCISSNTSSMPEVGGDLVAYIDPLNLRSGLETLRHFITQPAKVEEYEHAIQSRFKPRSWDDVSRDFVSMAKHLQKSLETQGATRFLSKLDVGEIVRIGTMTRHAKPAPIPTFKKLHRLLLAESYYPAEDFGAWMKGTTGYVKFATSLPMGARAIVHLCFTASDNFVTGRLLLSGIGVEAIEAEASPNKLVQIRLKVEVGEQGLIEVDVQFRGSHDKSKNGPRDFVIGLVFVAYVPEQDAIARTELLEHLFIDQDLTLIRAQPKETRLKYRTRN